MEFREISIPHEGGTWFITYFQISKNREFFEVGYYWQGQFMWGDLELASKIDLLDENISDQEIVSFLLEEIKTSLTIKDTDERWETLNYDSQIAEWVPTIEKFLLANS